MNQRYAGDSLGDPWGCASSFTLNIDAFTLDLGNPLLYKAYWQNNEDEISLSEWGKIEIALTGMADVLVMAPLS
jgi:hypothetical protein